MTKCIYCNKETEKAVDGFYCSQECVDKSQIAEQFESIEDDRVICPYCREVQDDINELYGVSNDEIECQSCEKKFLLTAEPYIRFIATATEEEIQKEYDREKAEE